MPLEIYAYRPTNDPLVEEDKKWKKITTVFPGEEVQIPNLPLNGKLEYIRVKVKPDDSMTTLHTIYPIELIIRDRKSDTPSQILFDHKQDKNRPQEIRKGESLEIFTRMPVPTAGGIFVAQTARGKLVQK